MAHQFAFDTPIKSIYIAANFLEVNENFHKNRSPMLNQQHKQKMPSASNLRPSVHEVRVMATPEQLDLLMRLIERDDVLRNSSTAKATTLLGANAFVLAALSVMFDKFLGITFCVHELHSLVLAIIITSVTALLYSIYQSLCCIAYPWSLKFRNCADTKGKKLFYNSFDTLRIYKTKDDLLNGFLSKTIDEMLDIAASELMFRLRIREKHINRLRHSIISLLAGMCLVILTMLMIGANKVMDSSRKQEQEMKLSLLLQLPVFTLLAQRNDQNSDNRFRRKCYIILPKAG